MSLKPDFFEGMRFEFTKPLNQHFAIAHRYTALDSEISARLLDGLNAMLLVLISSA